MPQELTDDSTPTDVLIKDTNANMNVYTDTLPDGTRKGKSNGNSCSKDSACGAAPLPPEKPAGCCGAGNSGITGDSGMASENTTLQPDLAKMAAEIGDVDLNEWIGTCSSLFHLATWAHSRVIRILPDFCRQILGGLE